MIFVFIQCLHNEYLLTLYQTAGTGVTIISKNGCGLNLKAFVVFMWE
jgi:hypothetical protein